MEKHTQISEPHVRQFMRHHLCYTLFIAGCAGGFVIEQRCLTESDETEVLK